MDPDDHLWWENDIQGNSKFFLQCSWDSILIMLCLQRFATLIIPNTVQEKFYKTNQVCFHRARSNLQTTFILQPHEHSLIIIWFLFPENVSKIENTSGWCTYNNFIKRDLTNRCNSAQLPMKLPATKCNYCIMFSQKEKLFASWILQ